MMRPGPRNLITDVPGLGVGNAADPFRDRLIDGLGASIGERGYRVSIVQNPLTSLADEDLRRALETVRGVGEVRLAGGLEREIRVFLQPGLLQSCGVSVGEIISAMQAQNLAVVKGLVSVAWADGRVSSEETEVLDASGRRHRVVLDPAEQRLRAGYPVDLWQAVEVGDAGDRAFE